MKLQKKRNEYYECKNSFDTLVRMKGDCFELVGWDALLGVNIFVKKEDIKKPMADCYYKRQTNQYILYGNLELAQFRDENGRAIERPAEVE